MSKSPSRTPLTKIFHSEAVNVSDWPDASLMEVSFCVTFVVKVPLELLGDFPEASRRKLSKSDGAIDKIVDSDSSLVSATKTTSGRRSTDTHAPEVQRLAFLP